MKGRVLLYGATGYTGREIARRLSRADSPCNVVLAGRDPSAVRRLADDLNCDFRTFPLTDHRQIEGALRAVQAQAVLHAAGPFAETAQPMMDACLETGAHYLDLCGEWPVFQAAMARDAPAKAAGIMLAPGVGLTIAATDCLLKHAAGEWEKTVRLRLGVSRAQVISRGSVATAARLAGPEALIRREGVLVGVPSGSLTHAFDFGDGLREATAVSWADVVTGEHSTGVRNIEVYSELGWPTRVGFRASGLAMSLVGARPWRKAGETLSALWPTSPSAQDRDEARFVMVAEALDAWGRPKHLSLRALDGYTASERLAVEAVRRVLKGPVEPGFQTPSSAFGSNFVIEAGAAEWLGRIPVVGRAA